MSATPAASTADGRTRALLTPRPAVGDVSGAVADLGVFVPLVAALVVVNGLDPAAVLVTAGTLVVVSGLRFGLPWPVQPLKAMTAIAVAQGLSAELLHTGGLLLGLCLLLLTATGLTGWLARWFTTPVIRGLQFAVGGLLVLSAVRLAATPPAVFAAAVLPGRELWLAGATVVAVAVSVARRWYAAGAVLLVAGVVATVAVAGVPPLGAVGPTPFAFGLPDAALVPTALVLLVLPQLPLTFGNAVVGVSDLAREEFGPRARRVTPAAVAVSAGAANVASAVVGGLPMCHGSSGFSAHVRLGARTAWMNVLLGSTLIVLGVVFPRQVLALLGLLPVWALAGFLAYAGCRHALLVTDLRGRALVVALVAGGAGLATGDLAVTTVVALAATHLRVPGRTAATAAPEPGV